MFSPIPIGTRQRKGIKTREIYFYRHKNKKTQDALQRHFGCIQITKSQDKLQTTLNQKLQDTHHTPYVPNIT